MNETAQRKHMAVLFAQFFGLARLLIDDYPVLVNRVGRNIYNGSSQDTWNIDWNTRAEEHFTRVEQSGFVPDIAVFETWDRHAHRIFPISDPGAHANLLLRYLRRVSTLRAAINGKSVDIVISADDGDAVANCDCCHPAKRRMQLSGALKLAIGWVQLS